MNGQQWVYIQSEPGLFTVGFYDPQGRWVPESDHDSRVKAGVRVHYLNGGEPATEETTTAPTWMRVAAEQIEEKHRKAGAQ